MADLVPSISRRLSQRRQRLGISCAVLAKRTGMSLRTVQRILSGEEANPGLLAVASLARELGVSLRFDDDIDVRTIRRQQAELKARRLLSMVQGSSALEAQPMSPHTLRELRDKTTRELLAGSSRKLWAD